MPKLPSTVYKANCYVILCIFNCLSFQKCIINDTFVVNYLKCYSYNVRNCFFIIDHLSCFIFYYYVFDQGVAQK